MPEVFLTPREINEKSLPCVCVVCGRKAKLHRIALIQEVNPLMSMFTRVSRDRMCDAWIPLCNSHQRYFGGLSLFGIGVLLLLLLFIGGIVLGAVVLEIRNPFFFLGGFCMFFAVAACATFGHLFYRLSRTRATEISKAGARLANVSAEFSAALEDDEDRD
jgi:hypothetical protein